MPPPTGDVLFAEDFGNNRNGWQLATNNRPAPPPAINGTIGLSSHSQKLVTAFSSAVDEKTKTSTGTIVEVDNTAVIGLGLHGLVCRWDNYAGYMFAIHNSRVGIFKVPEPDKSEELSGWQPVISFEQPGPKHLVIVCKNVGEAVQLEFWVNNVRISSATDSKHPLPRGPVGLYAVAGAQNDLAVEFDNLKVEAAR